MKRIEILGFIILLVILPLGAQKVYHPVDSDPIMESWRWRHFPELSKYGVQVFIENDEGVIWFGVNKGLVSFDGYVWSEYLVPKEFDHGYVLDIDYNKNIIYVTCEKGFYSFSDGKWKEILKLPSLSRRIFNQDVLVDRASGYIFLACNRGFFVYHNDKMHFYVGEKQRSIYDTVLANATIHTFPEELMADYFFATKKCIKHPDGRILALNQARTINGGVLVVELKYNDENPVTFNTINDLKGATHSPNFRCVASFVNGDELWVGGRITGKRVSRLKNNQWEKFSVSELFGDRDIYTGVTQMDDGSILLASEGQLYVQRRDEWKRYQFPEIPVTSTAHILLLRTRDGNLWIGGENNDIFFVEYSNNRWQTYPNLFYQF
ncbi:MAG: hypothetical protein MI922_01660, partial [Bacteroidales bacterium]|nr:hypothetical protein [Bacteroidales bacterium]